MLHIEDITVGVFEVGPRVGSGVVGQQIHAVAACRCRGAGIHAGGGAQCCDGFAADGAAFCHTDGTR